MAAQLATLTGLRWAAVGIESQTVTQRYFSALRYRLEGFNLHPSMHFLVARCVVTLKHDCSFACFNQGRGLPHSLRTAGSSGQGGGGVLRAPRPCPTPQGVCPLPQHSSWVSNCMQLFRIQNGFNEEVIVDAERDFTLDYHAEIHVDSHVDFHVDFHVDDIAT